MDVYVSVCIACVWNRFQLLCGCGLFMLHACTRIHTSTADALENIHTEYTYSITGYGHLLSRNGTVYVLL